MVHMIQTSETLLDERQIVKPGADSARGADVELMDFAAAPCQWTTSEFAHW